MRRLWIHLLGICLLSPAIGCCKTLRYTAGICDCNPPPVETILHQPCNQHHPIVNPYSEYVQYPGNCNHPAVNTPVYRPANNSSAYSPVQPSHPIPPANLPQIPPGNAGTVKPGELVPIMPKPDDQKK